MIFSLETDSIVHDMFSPGTHLPVHTSGRVFYREQPRSHILFFRIDNRHLIYSSLCSGHCISDTRVSSEAAILWPFF